MSPRSCCSDEPLSNLDAKLRVQMRSEIKALQRATNITTIFVTHDQAEALAISDQIAVMHGGVLIEVGAPHQLYTRPKRRFTATFLGFTNLIDGKVAGSRRRWPARKNANQEGYSKFHSRARPEEGSGRGDLDPAGKYPAYTKTSRRDWRTSLKASSKKRSSWATLISAKSPSATI